MMFINTYLYYLFKSILKSFNNNNMKKIAFCFLIYDIINHEELWNQFFLNVDKNKYNIYIHYKYNVPLTYFEKYKLAKIIETAYADISLVKAQDLLLENALKDENDLFIFLSNSCIPLKSFNYVYNILNENFSYFNVSSQTQCFPRCNKTLEYMDKQYIQKASQWCILNQKHAKLLLKNQNDYIKWFNYKETVPDEHCYITFFYKNNLQNELIITMNESINATTFVNWEGTSYKYPSKHGLKNYQIISHAELIYLLNSKSLFGRKFNKECKSMINNQIYIENITHGNIFIKSFTENLIILIVLIKKILLQHIEKLRCVTVNIFNEMRLLINR